jgi:hypothetical protein
MASKYAVDAAVIQGLLKKLRKGQNVNHHKTLNQALEFVLRYDGEEAKDLAWDVVLEVGKTKDSVENWLRGLSDTEEFHYVQQMKERIARTCFDAEGHGFGAKREVSPKFIRAFLDPRIVSERTRGQITVTVAYEAPMILRRVQSGLRLCAQANVRIDRDSGWTTAFAAGMSRTYQGIADVLDATFGVCKQVDESGLRDLLSDAMSNQERLPATNLRRLLVCLSVAIDGLAVVRGLTLQHPYQLVVQALASAVFHLAEQPASARD